MSFPIEVLWHLVQPRSARRKAQVLGPQNDRSIHTHAPWRLRVQCIVSEFTRPAKRRRQRPPVPKVKPLHVAGTTKAPPRKSEQVLEFRSGVRHVSGKRVWRGCLTYRR